MDILSFLKPAPHIAQIENESEIQKKYKYWRLRIFLGMYVGYFCYYLTRKCFTFVTPAMIKELGFTKADLGAIASILYISYGVSKFLSGIHSDRSNPRYFMAVGLMLTGVFSILFGCCSTLLFFGVFWGLNGWFQGWGWPPCTRLLTHWFTKKERGTWWSLQTTSQNLGGAMSPIIVAFAVQHLGWKFGMWIPGVCCLFGGLYLMNRLRDTPQSVGLPSIETFAEGAPVGHKERELSAKEILFKYVLSNKYIWILAFTYFFIYVIRTAINDWTMLYLIETKGYSHTLAGVSIFWFEGGGICGGLAAGYMSDRLFEGRRGTITMLYCLGISLSVLLFYLAPASAKAIDFALLFIVGFFVFGPQMLIGLIAGELSHKKAAGTATGFTGVWGYLGAAAAGYPIAKMIENVGWHGHFMVLAVCGVISALLLIPISRKKAEATEPC